MKPEIEYILKYGRTGDIVGCSGQQFSSDVINLCTYGIPRRSLSHVGILVEIDGKLFIFQSTTLCVLPCYFAGEKVSGTQAQEIEKFLHWDRSRIWHYPLSRELYNHEKVRLRRMVMEDLGRPYDMVGALSAGGFLLCEVGKFISKQSKAAIYCSEWCAELHSGIGIFPTGNYSYWNPNSFVRRERGYGVLCPPIQIAG